MRQALEYVSSIWSPLASSTSINKLQVMQNAALRTATGCTQDTKIQDLHDEILTLPIHKHLQLHASEEILPRFTRSTLPNSEQTNLPSSNHTYTKSTLNHTHHHYTPSVTHTHTTHTISSSASTYAPHCHPWICGHTPLE